MVNIPYTPETDEGGATGRPGTFLADPGYDIGSIYEVGILTEWDG